MDGFSVGLIVGVVGDIVGLGEGATVGDTVVGEKVGESVIGLFVGKGVIGLTDGVVLGEKVGLVVG